MKGTFKRASKRGRKSNERRKHYLFLKHTQKYRPKLGRIKKSNITPLLTRIIYHFLIILRKLHLLRPFIKMMSFIRKKKYVSQ